MSGLFRPDLGTPEERHSKVEQAKRRGLESTLYDDFRSAEADIPWETEQIAKSYGIYLEFNRALTGSEKDWFYMIRVGVPGGGPITVAQWAVLDELSERFSADPLGRTSLRLTTRENIQFHWVRKPAVVPIIKAVAESGLLTLNGCGDNVRNVMTCPLSSHSDVFNANALADEIARYFQLPSKPYIKIFAIDPASFDAPVETFRYGPQLLNRKFKMGILGVHRDVHTGGLHYENCVEVRTNDVGLVPLLDAEERFLLFIGGGQGEKFGKPTASMLSQPFVTVPRARLIDTLDAIVAVQQDWGDRRNRHWARLKYVVKAQGLDWFRREVEARVGFKLGAPIDDFDVGARELHHGWTRQPRDGRWSFGAFIENGRITDASPNGRLKTMARQLSGRFAESLFVTPNQDLIFSGIAGEAREDFEAALEGYGYGLRGGREYSALRRWSGACVGKDTCRVAYTDSEKFEPQLIDELERLGWGDLPVSIGVTGCERQCYRPATKAIGILGSGKDLYQFKLLGSEDGRHQGMPVELNGEVYLSQVPRERVAAVVDALFRLYQEQKQGSEAFGAVIRRLGLAAVLEWLRGDEAVGELVSEPSTRAVLSV